MRFLIEKQQCEVAGFPDIPVVEGCPEPLKVMILLSFLVSLVIHLEHILLFTQPN